ncbi:hypothetical protein A3J13_02275 [Candidatus Daviesbacteria bacterium RIFCSPLOWO2_02_FULL_36_8]|uniref:FAD-binding FR-type domain-containing protein n=1 Tax=Candidatus Daviesbacteria bacterium RIFCSPLOWO2_02_FULL_36_8 TaxID=1797793 RepID=A0A1F5MH34_9BACT|nr:MAG: hypothetical protein A3J13_02275 [Candidatus Daviesbacteria bacterium RIFCSPLOWO2_02_FULL_36_8]
MLYFLLVLVVYSSALCFLEILPYNGFDILISSIYLVTICWFSNKLLAKLFKVPINIESSLITGFILSLIFGPASFLSIWPTLTVGGISAMASKYLIAWKGRHIFNPAAFGAVASALILNQGASWWVGSEWMVLPILLGGFLILRKVKRFTMVFVFTLGFLLPVITTGVGKSEYLQDILAFLITSPILFFSLVMLIEPQTSPYKNLNQVLYGILVAVGFYMSASFGIFYLLEASLLVGNVFAFLVNRSFRKTLKLKEKKQESEDVVSFLFEPNFKFEAGQYLEWTLPHPKPDSRGVRRFFTISSSPTEGFLMITTRFAEKSSTFKSALKKLESGQEISVSNLEGDFTLPRDTEKKLVFIAGGIGITPFRSMIKYLIDRGEKRDIVLLYSVKTLEEIVFKYLFDEAKFVGVSAVYVSTDTMGFIDQSMIQKQIPDYKERYFYISGPQTMVDSFKQTLKAIGISSKQIRTDFFPGYA